jgi:hypothetical protein
MRFADGFLEIVVSEIKISLEFAASLTTNNVNTAIVIALELVVTFELMVI